jgi:hypothetical protein
VEDLLVYTKQFGPWVALLVYYFFRLDRQIERIIELLTDQRHLLELIVHGQKKE